MASEMTAHLGRLSTEVQAGGFRTMNRLLSPVSGYAYKSLLLAGAAALLVLGAAVVCPFASAQQTVALPETGPLLESTLRELRSTVTELHVAKWKAPGPVKDDALSNLGSIDRDLQNTLPGLVAQADGLPRSVANAFAVYRNLDALYEVLLRVSGTAELAAPDEEAAMVSHSLMTLDAARRSLADSILSASKAQEATLVAPRPAPAPPPPAPVTAVVSDGPATAPAQHKSKPKAKVAKPAAQPTPQT